MEWTVCYVDEGFASGTAAEYLIVFSEIKTVSTKSRSSKWNPWNPNKLEERARLLGLPTLNDVWYLEVNVNSWNSQLPLEFLCGQAEPRQLKALHCSAFVLRAGTTYLNVRQWELLWAMVRCQVAIMLARIKRTHMEANRKYWWLNKIDVNHLWRGCFCICSKSVNRPKKKRCCHDDVRCVFKKYSYVTWLVKRNRFPLF